MNSSEDIKAYEEEKKKERISNTCSIGIENGMVVMELSVTTNKIILTKKMARQLGAKLNEYGLK